MLRFEQQIGAPPKPVARKPRPQTAKWASSLSPHKRKQRPQTAGARLREQPKRPENRCAAHRLDTRNIKAAIRRAHQRRHQENTSLQLKHRHQQVAWDCGHSDVNEPDEGERCISPKAKAALRILHSPEEWFACPECALALRDPQILLELIEPCVRNSSIENEGSSFITEIFRRYQHQAVYALFDDETLLRRLLPVGMLVPFLQGNIQFFCSMMQEYVGFRQLVVKVLAGSAGAEKGQFVSRSVSRLFLLEFCETEPSLFTQLLCDQEEIR